MKKYIKYAMIGLLMFILPQQGNTQETNYLILDDIGSYKLEKESREFPDRKLRPIIPFRKYNGSAGILGGADHFNLDHTDVTYTTGYDNDVVGMGVSATVTQHAGADSDKWLLHEIEDSYRDPDDEDARLGMLLQATRLREIDGNKIIGRRGNGYTWVRNNIVVDISYTDLDGTKPEPLEIVQAYLVKFPSTITMTPADLKGNDHNVQWIKDEMERQLWLCDKWSMQLQLGKVSQAEMLQALVKHMTIFLNYRQKYLSQYVEKEKTADKEITALSTYLTANDGTSIKAKLTEYKTWWTANKSKSISL